MGAMQSLFGSDFDAVKWIKTTLTGGEI